jgi:hypothetical protein
VVGSVFSCIEPLGSVTRELVGWLVGWLDVSEICCEDGRWMELAQDCVQWPALVLAVLNLQVLLPER